MGRMNSVVEMGRMSHADDSSGYSYALRQDTRQLSISCCLSASSAFSPISAAKDPEASQDPRWLFSVQRRSWGFAFGELPGYGLHLIVFFRPLSQLPAIPFFSRVRRLLDPELREGRADPCAT